MKLKNIFVIVFLGLLAILVGLAIATYRISRIQTSPAFAQYGSWRGSKDLPLNRDDLVTTQVTLFALFALPSEEAVYLFAMQDVDNKSLNGNSDYVIEGNVHNIKATYWSITAYGKDQFLIPNDANRYSFNANSLVTDSLGNYKIILSARRKVGNWLPLAKDVPFRLVLRLYQGNKDFLDHLDSAGLPVIKKL
jgi:hypothetical protein